MTMFLEQESPIPSDKTLEKRNNDMERSPLSEEIRQRAARWRKIRESCPELTVSDASDPGSSNTGPGSPPPGEQDQQQDEQEKQSRRKETKQKSGRKSPRVPDELSSSADTERKSTSKSKSKSPTPQKKGGRLRYSEMKNSKLGESWQQPSTTESSSFLHIGTEEGNGKDAQPTPSSNGRLVISTSTINSSRRNFFRKTLSVPSFATTPDDSERNRPRRGGRMRNKKFQVAHSSEDSNNDDQEEDDNNDGKGGTLSRPLPRSTSGMESYLGRVASRTAKQDRLNVDETTVGDETIDDSARSHAELRMPSTRTPSSKANNSARNQLDDFLDALIQDARETTTSTKDAVGTTTSTSKTHPLAGSHSSRQSAKEEFLPKGSNSSAQSFASRGSEASRRSQLDPPQVIGKKKFEQGGLASPERPHASNRGKDPPGKIKKTKNVPLGGFMETRRKKDGRPTGAATVAGDRFSNRLSGIDEDAVGGKKKTSTTIDGDDKEANILDALLSPRKSTTAVRRASPLVLESIDNSRLLGRTTALKRANSMSVMGRAGRESDLISTILAADREATSPTKKTTTTGGPALGSFLDRRSVIRSRKSGANTVAGDRVAIRPSNSMNRTTREVLERLEADERGSSFRRFSESISNIGASTTTTASSMKGLSQGDSWRPARGATDAGMESAGGNLPRKVQELQSGPRMIHKTPSDEEADAIVNSERIFDRSTDSGVTSEEESTFDPHSSTSKMDLNGFLDGKTLKNRKKGGTQSVGGERARGAKKKLRQSSGDAASVGRRRRGSDADLVEASSTVSKPINRRILMEKMLSSPALGGQKLDDKDESSISPPKKRAGAEGRTGSKSPRSGSLRVAMTDETLGSPDIYVRADGKKVRRVHRKPVDGEIIIRPDGTKVRIRKIGKGKDRKPGDETRKSWLDQYLDGEEVPMASGHIRPVPRTQSGSMQSLTGRTVGSPDAVVKSLSLRSPRQSETMINTEKKPLSLKSLRDNEPNGTSESKPLSLRSALSNSDTGTDSGGDTPSSPNKMPSTPLSIKEQRKLFRRMNSVPSLAASPLVSLYDKKTDAKERARRPPLSEVPPESRVVSGTRMAPPAPLAYKPKTSANEPKRPDSDRAISYDASRSAKKESSPDSKGDAELSKKKAQEKPPKFEKKPSPLSSSRHMEPEDKKRQLLQNSDKLRKAQSLSNLGQREYDAGDRLILVERLRLLKNDVGVAGLRPKPKGDQEEIPVDKDVSSVKSKVMEKKKDSTVEKDGLAIKFAMLEAKFSESTSPGASRSRLRRVSSQSDVSSITELSRQVAPKSAKPQFSRWSSSPKQIKPESSVKSPRRPSSGKEGSPGPVERKYFLTNAIPAIDLESDELNISPTRPSSARTMNSGSGRPSSSQTLNSAGAAPGVVKSSNRTLNSDVGSAPPGQPTRKQSLLPGTVKIAPDEPGTADNEHAPPMPRRKLSTQPKTLSTIAALSKLSNVVENPIAEDKRTSLLTLGPSESPFRRSLARWSSVPKDLGSCVNDGSLSKNEAIAAFKAIEKGETKQRGEKGQPPKPSKADQPRAKRGEESAAKPLSANALFPAPGSQLIVFDDGGSVCSDITDCWTHETMSNWLAAETRRLAAGHNRRGSYDLGSIVKEEVGVPAPSSSGSRFEDLRSPLQSNRWEGSSNLPKEIDESLPNPGRLADESEPKREETPTNRFAWLKKFSFPRVKLTNGKTEGDERGLLNAQSDDEL